MGMPPRGRARRLALGMIYLGTAGLIAATLLAEFGDHWWIADLFAHFRFQYIVVALALSAAGLAIRARRAAALAAAGIDVCALANNHVLDFGAAGLFETLATLRAAGLATAGAGASLDEALRPASVALPGGGRLHL